MEDTLIKGASPPIQLILAPWIHTEEYPHAHTRCQEYLVICPGEQHWDHMEENVTVGPQGVGGGVLPSLKTTPIDNIMKLEEDTLQ